MASDGSIRIDTTINTSDFAEKIEKMKVSMQNFASLSSQAFENQSKTVLGYRTKIQQTEAEISRLTQQMNILRNQPVTNSSIENLKQNIAQTENEVRKVTDLMEQLQNQTGDVKLMAKFSAQIDDAYNRLFKLDEEYARMINAEVSAITPAGMNPDDFIITAEKNLQKTSAEWRNINKEILKVEAEVEKYKLKLDEASKIKGVDTAEYSTAQKKLESLNSKLDVYREKLQIAEKAEKNKISTKFSALAERVDKANAKLKEYNQQMARAGERAETTKSKTASLNSGLDTLISSVKKLALVFGVTFSVRQIYNWSKAWKEAYKVQLQAETQVATTMINSTNATLENVQAVKELASAQQALGIVGDEVQLAGLQELAVYASEADTLKKLLPAMNNLAAQRYGYVVTTENAKSVADLFGKALQGNTTMLKRNGFAISEAQEKIFKYGTESERAALLTEMVSRNIGNMNEALASTDIGKQQQLANTVGDLKELYGNIVSKIYTLMIPALKRIVTLLTDIGNLALDGLRSVYRLMGEKFDTANLSVGSMTGELDTATESAENLAGAVSDVEKSSKGALSSFDELDIIGKPETSSPEDTDNIEDTAEAILNENSAMESLNDITDECNISSSKLYNSLKKLADQLQRLKNFSGNALTDFYETFLKPLKNWTVNEALPRFIEILANGMAKTDWHKINDRLKKLWKALEPFAENIGEGLLWFGEHVLVSLGTWTLNKAVPAFLDMLTAGIDALNAGIELFKPLGRWFYDEFLLPLAQFSGNLAVSAIEGITKTIQGLTGFITENKDEIQSWLPVISGIATGIASAFAFKWVAGLAPKFAKIAAVCIKLAGKVTYLYNSFMALVKINGVIGGIGASINGVIGGIVASISTLWLTFKTFMTSLSPFAKVGVTIVALTATITTAYSAFKKLSEGSISLGKAIANIAVVAVPAGVALYAMLGPIGLVAAALGGLIGAMAGAAAAQKEMAEEMVANAVFDGIGTPITEYSDTIKSLADTISNEQSRILELGNSIDANNKTIDDNLTNLSMLMGSVKATGELTEESANKIIESFNAVADGINENLSLGTQSIIEGLGSSFDDLAGASGSMVSDMLSQLYLLQSDGDAYLANLKSAFSEAEMQMLKLDPNSAEYEEASKKVEDLRKQLTEYSMITNDAVTSADTLKDSIGNLSQEKIDLMDDKTASQAIKDISDNYNQAMLNLAEANRTAIKSLDNEKEALKFRQGFLSADDIHYFDDLAKLIDENYASQEQELTDTCSDIMAKLESQLSKSIDDAMIDALPKVSGAYGYIDAIIKTIGTNQTADQYIYDNLYNTVAGQTTKALEDSKASIKTTALSLGLNLSEGLADGVTDNSKTATDAISKVASDTTDTAKDAFDIHSPSKVFYGIGQYVAEGLTNGIKDNSILAVTAIAQTASMITSMAEKSLQPLTNVFDNVFDRILNSMQNFNYSMVTGIRDTLNTIIDDLNTTFSGINSVQFDLPMGNGRFGVDIPKIPHLATGGLISPRSEFMAVLGDNRRENEIVSPISAMKQAVMEAISESGINASQNISINIDGNEIFRVVIDQNRQYTKQTGKSALI